VTPLSLKAVVTSYILSLAVCNPGERLDGRPLRHAPRIRHRVAVFLLPRSWRPGAERADLVAGRILQGWVRR